MKNNQHYLIPCILILLCSLGFITCQQRSNSSEAYSSLPNIIIVYNDDLGYGDLSSYGSQTIKTPNIDQLASNGMKLTSFYVASPVCSPSRAALLTGSYPTRVGIPNVLAPHGISWAKNKWRKGLHPDEKTLAELLKQKGYTTGIFGKWHLGHMPQHLPYNHGFDTFFGIPYSNDMRPETNKNYPPLPLIKDSVIIEENPDQSLFTKRFTDEAINFMENSGDQPFFIYLANPMPHVPLYASENFEGQSEGGLYGDVIEEIDEGVGRIVDFLDVNEWRENTIVIFTSDNGPWLCYGNHAGSAGLLREGKHTTMEGGQRVPFIISWPAKIESRTSEELVTNMDLLPTLIEWVEGDQPSKTIDGIKMNVFFEGKSDYSGRKEFLYYKGNELQALRNGKWKLHKPHGYQQAGDGIRNNGERGQYDWAEIGWALYDLENDPGETTDRAAEETELVEKLKKKMFIADSLMKVGNRQPFIYEGEEPETGKLWLD